MRINLSKTPTFPQTYHTVFPNLDGGLNLRDLGYLVASNESPCMKNLVWRNGILQSRDGQRKVAKAISPEEEAIGGNLRCYAAYTDLFHGYAFFHVGDKIKCLPMSEPLTEPFDPDNQLQASTLAGSVSPGRGTFFRYQSGLYYKNNGGFYDIEYNENGSYPAKNVLAHFQMLPAPYGDREFDLYERDTEQEGYVFTLYSGEVTPDALATKRIILRDKATGFLLTPDDTPAIQVPEGAESVTITPGAPGTENVIYGCGLREIVVPDPHDPSITTTETYMTLRGAGPSPWADQAFLGADLATGALGFYSFGGPSDDVQTPLPELAWTIKGRGEGTAQYVILRNEYLTRTYGVDMQATYIPAYTIPAAPFICQRVEAMATTDDNAPVIVINASPVNGSGTMYQPENRLSPLKTVWYNGTADATTYYLPVQSVDRVTRVEVDGTVLTTGWYAKRGAGQVIFNTAPGAGTNNVRITYSKTNENALCDILNSRYACVVSGGEAAQYIVLGGNDAQPDAVFWNGNDELAIQPWYFPMPCYNLVGTAGDPVTGFGRQYDDTLVFSDHTVGKLTYGTQEIDGRLYPAFGYARVNSKIGCDLPWTIQQVENNVVFCNTYSGAHIVLSSSAAYENNIEQLSTKINEPRHEATGEISGLLADIAASTTDVVSFDDDERYWICANGKVYVWDYEISTYAKPSWLYWENIYPAALFRDDRHNPYHLGHDGYITAYLPGLLSDDVLDDGDIVQEAIEKVYRFPTLHFGSYDRLKDVVRLLLAVRSDVPSTIRVWYETDYEKREDQTPVVVQPINAPGQSNLHVQVARRNPGCRHVRQFSLTLTNDVPGEELALVSAEVYHRFTGPER